MKQFSKGKILLSTLLAVILVFGMTTMAFAETGMTHVVTNHLYYTVEDETTATAAVTGWTGSHSQLVVAATAGDYTVDTVSKTAFAGNTTVETITLPGTITKIEPGAFKGCTALKEVKFSEDNPIFKEVDGVIINKVTNEIVYYPTCRAGEFYMIPGYITSIAESAFPDNKTMRTLYMPASVTSVGADNFKEDFMMTIYGDNGSYAQTYADTLGQPFRDLGMFIKGDINSDSKVSILDAKRMLKYISGSTGINEIQIMMGDLNNDGRVSIADAKLLLKQIAAK